MFPESFAEHWIRRLTKPGETVFDPFCGRGTAPFQALLMGRKAVANDINPVAVCVTGAKLQAPGKRAVRERIRSLERSFEASRCGPEVPDAEFFRFAYQKDTLREICFLRRELDWRGSRVDRMVAALLLGLLHGESLKSTTYLSNQMPRTISTKPAYSVKYWKARGLRPTRREVFPRLLQMLDYRYSSPAPRGTAHILAGDMRCLAFDDRLRRLAPRCVITSPPYLDVTRFEEDQWLRLWLLGGPPHPTYGKVSRDDRHTNRSFYFNLLGDMWRMFTTVLAPKAHIVIRIGANGIETNDLAAGVEAAAMTAPRRVRMKSATQSAIQGRQTDSFVPGTKGCLVEVDCHLVMD